LTKEEISILCCLSIIYVLEVDGYFVSPDATVSTISLLLYPIASVLIISSKTIFSSCSKTRLNLGLLLGSNSSSVVFIVGLDKFLPAPLRILLFIGWGLKEGRNVHWLPLFWNLQERVVIKLYLKINECVLYIHNGATHINKCVLHPLILVRKLFNVRSWVVDVCSQLDLESKLVYDPTRVIVLDESVSEFHLLK